VKVEAVSLFVPVHQKMRDPSYLSMGVQICVTSLMCKVIDSSIRMFLAVAERIIGIPATGGCFLVLSLSLSYIHRGVESSYDISYLFHKYS
jgi:hypothetical protein